MESVEGFGDGWLSDGKGVDEIHGADGSTGAGLTEAVDQFDVVFGDFGLVILACSSKRILLFRHGFSLT